MVFAMLISIYSVVCLIGKTVHLYFPILNNDSLYVAYDILYEPFKRHRNNLLNVSLSF